MEKSFIDIELYDGSFHQFRSYHLQDYSRFINVPGVAVLIKIDFYGTWNRILKVEGESIGDILFSDRVKKYVVDEFYATYHFAFFHIEERNERQKLLDRIKAPKL